ncbi:MAG: anti-sigma-factor antagonist [Clostridia bacterium]|jgi:anti-sigma B factor antagonist|nr:anti-sigma-factor antagonist [Clostridia bacterium]
MKTNKLNDVITVQLPKDFVIKEAGEFRDQAYELVNLGNVNFIMDFKDCEFIDSSGLGVMVSVYKRCVEKGGSIKITHVKPQVMKVFQLTRLDKVFEIA